MTLKNLHLCIEYVDFQKKLRKIIDNLTEEKAKELGISRRALFYWRQKIREGKQIILKNKLKLLLFSNVIEKNL